MTQWLRDLAYTLRGFLETFGAMNLFFLRLVCYTQEQSRGAYPLIVQQIYNSGAMSLVLIMVCGFFVGMVLGLQGYENLQKFNSEDSVGTVAALSLFQELGPVLTALLWSGRAGTALASEIGLMRATDQLSAMEMMAVDPLRRVVVPRFLGGIVSMPFLAAIFSAIGVFGAYVSGVVFLVWTAARSFPKCKPMWSRNTSGRASSKAAFSVWRLASWRCSRGTIRFPRRKASGVRPPER